MYRFLLSMPNTRSRKISLIKQKLFFSAEKCICRGKKNWLWYGYLETNEKLESKWYCRPQHSASWKMEWRPRYKVPLLLLLLEVRTNFMKILKKQLLVFLEICLKRRQRILKRRIGCRKRKSRNQIMKIRIRGRILRWTYETIWSR